MHAAGHISAPEMLGRIGDLTVELHQDLRPLEQQWRKLQKSRTASLFQSFDWVRIAYATIDKAHTPCIVTGMNDKGLQFVLPLVREQHRFINRVRWVGGSHANTCLGMFSESFFENHGEDTCREIFKLLASTLHGVNYLCLRNQLPEMAGRPNPFFNLPRQVSVNQLYGVRISGGIEEVLSFGNRKRKRRSFRQQVKVAEENGGYELFIPQTREEIDASVDKFLANKAQRLKELGIKDVFSYPGADDFIRQLAHAPMKDGVQPLRIFELRIGGKTRAMYGSGIFGDYCQSCINSVTYDELARISPGEMVLYLMIERLHADGIRYLDLGVGAEQYKLSWCNDHYEMFDNLMPLNAAAVPYVFGLRVIQKIKAYLRRSETMWPLIKKMRQKVSGK